MRQILLILATILVTLSCETKSNKTKEAVTKNELTISDTNMGNKSNTSTDEPDDSEPDTIASLRFEGYYISKKGFPHLEFRDMEMNNYDFENPEENNLGNIPLVLKSENEPSGFLQNDELVGDWFIISIVTKMSNTYDPSTVTPIKALRWRIGNIKKDLETKTMKLMFNGYEEGDYAHLLFKDSKTGEEYDFGHPEENDLGDSEVVLKHEKSSFGFIRNDKFLGNQYIVTMVKKLSDTYDENGQPIKAKRWRIINLKR